MKHTVVDISSSESIRHRMNYYLPVEKCAFSKDIFRGLSRSWNFKEKKSRTFQEAWEPCLTLGTSLVHMLLRVRRKE